RLRRTIEARAGLGDKAAALHPRESSVALAGWPAAAATQSLARTADCRSAFDRRGVPRKGGGRPIAAGRASTVQPYRPTLVANSSYATWRPALRGSLCQYRPEPSIGTFPRLGCHHLRGKAGLWTMDGDHRRPRPLPRKALGHAPRARLPRALSKPPGPDVAAA